MPAEPEQVSETLNQYITELHKIYLQLINILEQEAVAISDSNERKLSTHAAMEADTVKNIISLTKSVHSYLDHAVVSELSDARLREIEECKLKAAELSRINIAALGKSLSGLKEKIHTIKLPQSAHRVYYSGNNPTIMDIEI
ncbi:MAG TPA: hypothetical protein DCO79_02245 [Spirochaeta sp.]|nr:hypothetical protein [Spirochaeta sp.]